MRFDSKHMGTCSITPDKDIIAGEFSTWKIKFTAGKYGIDDGGSLVIAWKSVSDWDTPQFDAPAEPGFTTITTTGNCKVKACYHKFFRSFGNSILIDVFGGYLKEGEEIEITLGDTSMGSLGMRAQSFCETEHEFRMYLDPCGTFRHEELPERMKVKIVPAWHHEIQAIVPGSVHIGEPFSIGIRVLDEFGNPTNIYDGTVHLRMLNGIAENLPEQITFQPGHNGIYRIEGVRIMSEGFWSIAIEDFENAYSAFSNGSNSVKPGMPLLHWGDMHAQTRHTVGTGMLEDYYSFARDKALIEFTGWQGNDFEITDETWQEVRSNTKKYNKEGEFLVYLGYEWSGITPLGGDYNVHFLNDSEEFYPSSNWSAPDTDPSYNATPASELHEKLGDRDDVMLIAHIGGRYANLDYLNPKLTSVIEIHSHHGTFEWFAFDAMKRHLHVGFIAESDDHTCRPGLSYPLSGHGKSASGAFDVANGFVGVYSEQLTKKSVWDAIKNRRCYASTFDRIYMDTSITDGQNTLLMGQEGTLSEKLMLRIMANANHAIESYDIYDWDKRILHKDLLSNDKKRIRVRWSGVVYRGRGKSAKWDGMLYVENGKIRSAKPYAFDRIDQGIITVSDKYVRFTSSTSGDYDGLILEIDGNENTMIKFSTKVGYAEASYKEILEKGFEKAMGGLNLMVEMTAAKEEPDLTITPEALMLDEQVPLKADRGEHAYWVRVLLDNGNAAWASPIFIND